MLCSETLTMHADLSSEFIVSHSGYIEIYVRALFYYFVNTYNKLNCL